MQLIAYLGFNGQCEEAFKFYQKCLGGKIEALVTHEGTPAAQHVPPEWLKKIMHARLNVDGQLLLGADAPPNSYNIPKGVSVMLWAKDPSEAERVFNALAENGKVEMPIQRRSGQRGSECFEISMEFRGWSTATRLPDFVARLGFCTRRLDRHSTFLKGARR